MHILFRITLIAIFILGFTFWGYASPNPASTDTLRITVSDGTELFVAVRGQGIPCLYIHGGPGVGSYWMQKLYGDTLEKYFTMIYLDQRGSGRSGSAASGDYSPERMAKDIDEVRKHLDIDSMITFSHSFGGLIQMEHARRYPVTVRGMILVASVLDLKESIKGMINYSLDLLEIKGDKRLPYLDRNISQLERAVPLLGKLREKGIFWKMHYGDQRNYDRMDSVMAEVENPNYAFSQKAMELEAYYKNYKPWAPHLTMPVLLFYGKQDHAVGPSHAKDINFPNALYRTWNGGHVPFMEGKQQLEQAIREWLVQAQLDVSR